MSVKCILTGQTPDINDIGAQPKITANGVLKGDGTGTVSSIAVATFTEIGDIDDIVTVQSADEVSY